MPTTNQTNFLNELTRLLKNGSSGSSEWGVVSTLTPQQQTLMNQLVGELGGGASRGGLVGMQSFGLQPGQGLDFGGVFDPTKRSPATSFQPSAISRRPGELKARPNLQQELESRQEGLMSPSSVEQWFQTGVAEPMRKEWDQTMRPRIEEAYAKAGLGHSVGTGGAVARSLVKLNEGLTSQLSRIQLNLETMRANLSQRERESRRGAMLGALGQSQMALIEGGGEISTSTRIGPKPGSKRRNFFERVNRASRKLTGGKTKLDSDKSEKALKLDKWKEEVRRKRVQEKEEQVKRIQDRREKKKLIEENTKRFKEKYSDVKKVKQDKQKLLDQIGSLQKRIREEKDPLFQKRLQAEVVRLRHEIDKLKEGV